MEVSDYYKNITQMYMIEGVFGQVFPQFMKVNSSTAVKNTQGVYVYMCVYVCVSVCVWGSLSYILTALQKFTMVPV